MRESRASQDFLRSLVMYGDWEAPNRTDNFSGIVFIRRIRSKVGRSCFNQR